MAQVEDLQSRPALSTLTDIELQARRQQDKDALAQCPSPADIFAIEDPSNRRVRTYLIEELQHIDKALGRRCYLHLLRKEFIVADRSMNAAALIIEKIERRAAAATWYRTDAKTTGRPSKKDIAMREQVGLVMLVLPDVIRVGVVSNKALSKILAGTVYENGFEEFIKAASNERYRRGNETTCPAMRIEMSKLDSLKAIAVDRPL